MRAPRGPSLDAANDAAQLAPSVAGGPLVSSGLVSQPDRRLGFSRGLLVRDPVRHVMEITEP